MSGADKRIRRAADQIRQDVLSLSDWARPFLLNTADWLDDVATRHARSKDTINLYLHYDSDEECGTCEDGGHECHVCEGCYPAWDGMDAHVVYPCAETKAALAVATSYLSEAPS